MRKHPAVVRSSLALVTALLLAVAAPGGDGGPPQGEVEMEKVYWDSPDETGLIVDGGIVMLPFEQRTDDGGIAGIIPVDWTTLEDNGPPSNRIDLVFVGDGYLESEIPSYAAHVNNGRSELFGQEPFLTYANYFNVHRVDVISPESGVDNDPVPGVERDTALDMAFWCAGIERLLCVNVGAAYDYALNAPEVDQLFAVANSSKYGGAGYSSSELATFSGGNGAAPEVAIHEIGHSLGDLADEYDYGDGVTYTGPERPEPNISILTQAEMIAAGTKWVDWIDEPGINNYEGAYYSQFGIYRPDVNSKMRSLGAPFNKPSIEALIIEFYQLVNLIDDTTPTDDPLFTTDIVFVSTQDPIGHSLTFEWRLDSVTIPGATGDTLDIGTLGELVGEHTLQVIVQDDTDAVRDEGARFQYMTEIRSWTVSGLADCNNNDVSDDEDLAAGTSTDCNNNDRPDECDEWPAHLTVESPQLSPIGAGTAQVWTLVAAPAAAGEVTITVTARADLGDVVERLPFSVSGVSLGSLFGPGASDCPASPDVTVVTMTAEQFNAAVLGGDAVISIGATAGVDPAECDPPSWVSVALDYDTVLPAADCDDDGVVDGCEILAGADDIDGDGVPDACQCPADVARPADGIVNVDDLVEVIVNWGLPGGPADVNGDGMVDVNDLVEVVTAWGPC